MRVFVLLTILAVLAVVPGFSSDLAITAGQKKLPLSGEAFQLDGNDAFVILPDVAKDNVPWIWYAPTLPNLPGGAEIWLSLIHI